MPHMTSSTCSLLRSVYHHYQTLHSLFIIFEIYINPRCKAVAPKDGSSYTLSVYMMVHPIPYQFKCVFLF